MDSPSPTPPQTRPCPACGEENDPARNFCRACGARLSPAAPPPASRRKPRAASRWQLSAMILLAGIAALLLAPVRGGERGDDAALDRASRKYLALAQALVAGQGDSRSFTEAELNAFLAANARDGKNRPVAMTVRLLEAGFELRLPSRSPLGAAKRWRFRLGSCEDGRAAATLTGFSLGRLPLPAPLARAFFESRTWPAWKEESRDVVSFLSALSAESDGKTLVLSAK